MNFRLSSLFARRTPASPSAAPPALPELSTPVLKWAVGTPLAQPDPTGDKLMFIPKPLSIEGMPLLRVLPANIMFASPVPGGWVSSLYIYDLNTLEITPDRMSMTYRNDVLSAGHWVHIEYDRKEKSWKGEKYINEKMACAAIGADWKNFFIHLTLLGLTVGEPCQREPPVRPAPADSPQTPRQSPSPNQSPNAKTSLHRGSLSY